MKQHPISEIKQGEESVTFFCPGNQQFVVLPEDVAKRIVPISPRGQQFVTKTHGNFRVHLRPAKVAQLRSWADLMEQEKAEALASLQAKP